MIENPKTCSKCKQPVDAQDNFCRHCGAGQNGHAAWYFQHYGIIIVIMLVGPFALYNVLKSPVIGKTAKIIYTVVIFAFTGYVAYQMYNFMAFMNNIASGNLEALGL